MLINQGRAHPRLFFLFCFLISCHMVQMLYISFNLWFRKGCLTLLHIMAVGKSSKWIDCAFLSKKKYRHVQNTHLFKKWLECNFLINVIYTPFLSLQYRSFLQKCRPIYNWSIKKVWWRIFGLTLGNLLSHLSLLIIEMRMTYRLAYTVFSCSTLSSPFQLQISSSAQTLWSKAAPLPPPSSSLSIYWPVFGPPPCSKAAH